MPFLTSLRSEAVYFSKFISQQRQTNRGQYAILCGDFPNLAKIEAKANIYMNLLPFQRKKCLPQVLKEQGFSTAYLQAAPITFMSKDRLL